jgi:hypothetical protein
VLVGTEFALPVVELTPQSMQMDRVFHHGVVDEHKAHTFAALELDWFGFRKFPSVEAPDKALHVAGEMQGDLARGRPLIVAAFERAQIGVAQDASSVIVETVTGFAETLLRHHCDVVDFDAWLWRLGGGAQGHPTCVGLHGAAHIHALHPGHRVVVHAGHAAHVHPATHVHALHFGH